MYRGKQNQIKKKEDFKNKQLKTIEESCENCDNIKRKYFKITSSKKQENLTLQCQMEIYKNQVDDFVGTGKNMTTSHKIKIE